jgi:hypothetical protein
MSGWPRDEQTSPRVENCEKRNDKIKKNIQKLNILLK